MKICTNCNYIGTAQRKNFLEGNIYIGIIYLLIGIIAFLTIDFSGLNIIKIVIALYFSIMGIKTIIEHERGGKICPNCKKPEMISLDNPEAQKIIKENNITIPEQST